MSPNFTQKINLGKEKNIERKLQTLSTLNCHETMIVMNSGSQLSLSFCLSGNVWSNVSKVTIVQNRSLKVFSKNLCMCNCLAIGHGIITLSQRSQISWKLYAWSFSSNFHFFSRDRTLCFSPSMVPLSRAKPAGCQVRLWHKGKITLQSSLAMRAINLIIPKLGMSFKRYSTTTISSAFKNWFS